MGKVFIFLAAILIFPALLCAATLSNKYLLVDVDEETGRLFLSTVEGHENIEGDEKLNLLFFDRPPSSYTVIYIDNDVVIYGSQRGSFTGRPITVGNRIEAVWENELISAAQSVEFIKRKKTRIEDGIIINYRIKNKSEYPQEVGIRILFDTYLGERGLYHFELPGNVKLRYETEFVDDNLPDSWLSKDFVENPQFCLRGVLKEDVVTLPDKVVFANYKSLREKLFYYRVRKKKKFDNLPYSKNDSAVAIYYNPGELGPGEEREYSTILGLSGEEEYGEEVIEIIGIEEEPPEEEEPLKIPLRDDVDLEFLIQELARIRRIKGSIEDINRLIDELNQILKTENRIIGEEELNKFKKSLNELKKMREEIE